jgi:hypothetical protein
MLVQALLNLLYSVTTKHLESHHAQEGFQVRSMPSLMSWIGCQACELEPSWECCPQPGIALCRRGNKVESALQVFTEPVYALVLRPQAQQERVGRLIKYLQAMRGQQLWQSEEVTLTRPSIPSAAALEALVTSLVRDFIMHRFALAALTCCEALSETWHVFRHWPACSSCHILDGLGEADPDASMAQVDIMAFEVDLRERWSSEALRWLLECSSRHMARRSHQVLRSF